MNLNRLKFLLNRTPAARLRVDRALHIRGQRGVRALGEARAAYQAIRNEITALQDQARPFILSIENSDVRSVMEMRFLLGLTARQIAFRLYFSEQHVFRLLRRGQLLLESQESHSGGTIDVKEVENG